jgi:hypothetical protein
MLTRMSDTTASRWASRLSPANVAGAVVLAAVPAKLLGERLSDLDLWWHLRTGKYIVATHTIPHADIYSYTAAGKRWVVQEWGSEVILHGIRAAFGLYGILVWRAAMLLAIYAIVAHVFVRRMGNRIGTWGLVALTAYAGSLNWTERPNLFSFLLFVITLELIEARDKRLWLFVPVATLWANLHGMVVIGIGLVGVVAAAETLKIWLHDPTADPFWAKRLGLVTGASVAAMIINPRGFGLIAHAAHLVGVAGKLITEWASPNFHEIGTLGFLGLLLVVIASFALAKERPDTTDVVLALAFTVLGLGAVRNLALASIVLGLVASRTVPPALEAIHARQAPRPAVGSGSSIVLGGTALVAALVLMGIVAASRFPASDRPRDIINPEYTVAAIDALDAPGVRLFAPEVWAGMAIDRDWPNVRVFLDSRVDMYGLALARAYLRVLNAAPGWDRELDRSCTTHVLVRPRDPIAQVLPLSGAWRPGPRDRRSITFVRTRAAPGCPESPSD